VLAMHLGTELKVVLRPCICFAPGRIADSGSEHLCWRSTTLLKPHGKLCKESMNAKFRPSSRSANMGAVSILQLKRREMMSKTTHQSRVIRPPLAMALITINQSSKPWPIPIAKITFGRLERTSYGQSTPCTPESHPSTPLGFHPMLLEICST
jgi:hypothetical protein